MLRHATNERIQECGSGALWNISAGCGCTRPQMVCLPSSSTISPPFILLLLLLPLLFLQICTSTLSRFWMCWGWKFIIFDEKMVCNEKDIVQWETRCCVMKKKEVK